MDRVEYEPFTLDVPKAFKGRWASIFRPKSLMPAMSGDLWYMIAMPAADLPKGAEEWLGFDRGEGFQSAVKMRGGVPTVVARSRVAPLIVPGVRDGDISDQRWWQHLRDQCVAHNLPLDFLMGYLHLRVLVQPFEFDRRAMWGNMVGIGLGLKAVQVVQPSDTSGLEDLVRRTRDQLKKGAK